MMPDREQMIDALMRHWGVDSDQYEALATEAVGWFLGGYPVSTGPTRETFEAVVADRDRLEDRLRVSDEMVERAAAAFFRPSAGTWAVPPLLARNMRAALEAALNPSEAKR